jgi:hypothetical protein
MIMKKILSVALIGIGLCMSQTAFADDIYQQDSHATMISKRGGFFRSSAWSDRKLSNDRWKITEFGNNATSGARVLDLAKYQLAQIAIEHGYAYFDFTPTRKSVSCINSLTSDSIIHPTVEAVSQFATKPSAGMESAKEFIADNISTLSHDASAGEKRAVFAYWEAACLNKHPAKGQRATKMINAVTDIAVKAIFGF